MMTKTKMSKITKKKTLKKTSKRRKIKTKVTIPKSSTKDKLMELTLYIANKSEDDLNFGKTKLNKLLFAIDFNSYGFRGESITKVEYKHLSNGPVPSIMREVLSELMWNKRAEVVQRKFYTFIQERVIAKSAPNLSLFTKEEICFVDHWIQSLWNFNATDLSKWTHNLIPWLITKNNEVIPYHSIFVMEKLKVEKEGFIWAKKEIKNFEKSK